MSKYHQILMLEILVKHLSIEQLVQVSKIVLSLKCDAVILCIHFLLGRNTDIGFTLVKFNQQMHPCILNIDIKGTNKKIAKLQV